MYRAYNLKLSKENPIKNFDIYQDNYNNNQKEVSKFQNHLFDKIDNDIKITDDEGTIDVSKLKETWFPQINYDIFLSHSHEDKELATKLATYLKINFNLNTFIDSNVWGYSNELLKKIDNKYCVLPESEKNGHITYDYDKRNYSTSQVNLILSSAFT